MHRIWVSCGRPKPATGKAANLVSKDSTTSYAHFQSKCIAAAEDAEEKKTKDKGYFVTEFKLATLPDEGWQVFHDFLMKLESWGLSQGPDLPVIPSLRAKYPNNPNKWYVSKGPFQALAGFPHEQIAPILQLAMDGTLLKEHLKKINAAPEDIKVDHAFILSLLDARAKDLARRINWEYWLFVLCKKTGQTKERVQEILGLDPWDYVTPDKSIILQWLSVPKATMSGMVRFIGMVFM